MEQATLDNLKIIMQQEMANSYMHLEIHMKVSGIEIELKEMEFIKVKKEESIKVNGQQTNNMDTVQKYGQMALNMKANMLMALNKGMECINGIMEQLSKEIGKRI